jgi:hypothetical protein
LVLSFASSASSAFDTVDRSSGCTVQLLELALHQRLHGPADHLEHHLVVGFQVDKLKEAALCALHSLPAICALGDNWRAWRV